MPRPGPRLVTLTAARFASRAAALDNARLCYGAEARIGHAFRLAEDRHGWGWAPLQPVPELAQRGSHRTGEGFTVRPRKRGKVFAKLQPAALDA